MNNFLNIDSEEFFASLFETAKNSEIGLVMAGTVEDSPWHREANVWVHTEMCLEHYFERTAPFRSERMKMITAITLLFHDFGKPESKEVLDLKDGSGTYNRFAGHESVSANEFISFMCNHEDLTKQFFNLGFDWMDIRKIKFMIENHLPFSITNPSKRQNLRQAVDKILGNEDQCFYDQLWSDCSGRISDDHTTKKLKVAAWILEFEAIRVINNIDRRKQIDGTTLRKGDTVFRDMYVLVGTVGAGKSTWSAKLKSMNRDKDLIVVSLDTYRVEFFKSQKINESKIFNDPKILYAEAFEFCTSNKKAFDDYVKFHWNEALVSDKVIVLDNTNQSRKSRASWIQDAKAKGYYIHGIEFYISKNTMMERQKFRKDKSLSATIASRIYSNMHTVWEGVEVDSVEIVKPF